METNLSTTSDQIVEWLKNYCLNNNITSLIVGVSGGVDSGLVSTLCAKTKLPTYVISMPIHQKIDQLERATNHCKWLTEKYSNVTFIEQDLTSIADIFKNTLQAFSNPLGNANTRSRLRMVCLYQIASQYNGIVVGTGNKIEDFGIGFFTKYGDGGVDISPIADLTKTEVKTMAHILGVPNYIVNAIPTDGLWEEDRTDENQIGASYEELEWAMSTNKSHKFTERQKEVYNIYHRFNKKNQHKMLPIPIFKKNNL